MWTPQEWTPPVWKNNPEYCAKQEALHGFEVDALYNAKTNSAYECFEENDTAFEKLLAKSHEESHGFRMQALTQKDRDVVDGFFEYYKKKWLKTQRKYTMTDPDEFFADNMSFIEAWTFKEYNKEDKYLVKVFSKFIEYKSVK